MLSKLLSIPFIICALAFLYMAWETDSRFAKYIVPNVVALVVIYLFSPQIDWWWYRKNPPKLPEGLIRMFATRIPFFQKLSPPEKTRFCHRVALYMEANEFIPKGMESMPLDIKAVIAASAVQVTFYREDYLLNKFEHIIIYPHPFPSPQYQQWHASEIYEPDGVIMFSAEQLMAGFAQPARFFHIGFYEYARVFMRCYPDLAYPEPRPDTWQQLHAVSGFTREAIEKWIGLKQLDVQAVAIACYFTFPEKFRTQLPDWYVQLSAIFGPADSSFSRFTERSTE